MQAKSDMGGFISYAEKLNAQKVRGRSEKFFDHFSQAALFYHSQSHAEKMHIVQALRFELGKVEVPAIRERMVGLLTQVDKTLAGLVAQGLGLLVPAQPEMPMNLSVPADGDLKRFQPKPPLRSLARSAALTMATTPKVSIKTRKVAILAADGVDEAAVNGMKNALLEAGARPKVIAPRLGILKGAKQTDIPIDFSFLTAGSVLFDAVYIPGGQPSLEILMGDAKALQFVRDAYLHCKAIAATGAGIDLLLAAHPAQDKTAPSHAEGVQTDERTLLGGDEGIIAAREDREGRVIAQFIAAIAQHRHWARELKGQVPA